jgi:2-methylcitrate dehydratase PrpD
MKNGARFSHTARIAKGDPRNPMTDEEVLEKFRSNAKSVLSQEQAEKLAAVVHDLEVVSNIRQVTALLTPV